MTLGLPELLKKWNKKWPNMINIKIVNVRNKKEIKYTKNSLNDYYITFFI
jgi:hypothetical protein